MIISYDNEADALYIKLSNEEPDGVVEYKNNLNIDTAQDGKLCGIEILNASKTIDLKTILSYSLDVNGNFLKEVV